MYFPIKNVTPIDGYRLLLTFGNGEERIFDVSPYLEMGKFSELRDTAMFNSVRLSFDTIEWANHLDMDPEFLYSESVGAEKAEAV